jgi:hypothetical protein
LRYSDLLGAGLNSQQDEILSVWGKVGENGVARSIERRFPYLAFRAE